MSCVPAAFAGQLDDGSSVSLGELIVPNGGEQLQLRELQLKGVGPTPFTRSGLSGRKRLEPLLKEAVMMETLVSIGIPTSQALAVVFGDQGDASMLRSGASFVRFGTFELANQAAPNGKAGPSMGDYDLLQKIADYTIASLYPDVIETAEDEDAVYREFVLAVTRQMARLVAHWMCFGWVHGALNTDNLAISGETLDHGSVAFMATFRHDWTGNVDTDRHGMYVYDQQPLVCRGHCIRLAESLQPLHCEAMADVRPQVEASFDKEYRSSYLAGMRCKLGWVTSDDDDMVTMTEANAEGDAQSIAELLTALEEDEADFTATFAMLAAGNVDLLPPAVATWAKQLCGHRRLSGQGCSPSWVPSSTEINAVVAAAVGGDSEAFAGLRNRLPVMSRLP